MKLIKEMNPKSKEDEIKLYKINEITLYKQNQIEWHKVKLNKTHLSNKK